MSVSIQCVFTCWLSATNCDTYCISHNVGLNERLQMNGEAVILTVK